MKLDADLEKQVKRSASRWMFYRSLRQIFLGFGLMTLVLAWKVSLWFYIPCAIFFIGIPITKIFQSREVRSLADIAVDSFPDNPSSGEAPCD